MRVLIDTCVILDVLQNREPFAEDGKNIFLKAANIQFNGFITAKSITDIFYILNKYYHNSAQAKEIINTLIDIFGVLDTLGIDCQKALLSNINDYEDSVMVETAIRSEIDCIVTRNLKDYSFSKIQVMSPNEFINSFKTFEF